MKVKKWVCLRMQVNCSIMKKLNSSIWHVPLLYFVWRITKLRSCTRSYPPCVLITLEAHQHAPIRASLLQKVYVYTEFEMRKSVTCHTFLTSFGRFTKHEHKHTAPPLLYIMWRLLTHSSWNVLPQNWNKLWLSWSRQLA